eukprot:6202419-Pleurochrysis_carterae.AAC.7
MASHKHSTVESRHNTYGTPARILQALPSARARPGQKTLRYTRAGSLCCHPVPANVGERRRGAANAQFWRLVHAALRFCHRHVVVFPHVACTPPAAHPPRTSSHRQKLNLAKLYARTPTVARTSPSLRARANACGCLVLVHA